MVLYRVIFLIILLVGGLVFACIAGWQDERLRIGTVVTFGSLLLAIVFIALLEKSSREQRWLQSWAGRAAIASCGGVCVGIALLAGGYFLAWPQWLIIAIAVPAGGMLFAGICMLHQ